MAPSPYHQLFRHRIKYLAQRYDGDKIDSKGGDRTLISVFHSKSSWHRRYEDDCDPGRE